MRAVGQVLRRARSGRIIVKLFVEVKEGTQLYDRRGRRVGVVREVFGPVRSPYASLEAKTDRVGGIIGETLYSRSEPEEGEEDWEERGPPRAGRRSTDAACAARG
ncbi:MAG: hypothetical protein JHC24_03465 [Thaumarchaeota archaeon]|nr:hypothetical protein [Nitrososphaerota archaeon]